MDVTGYRTREARDTQESAMWIDWVATSFDLSRPSRLSRGLV